MDLENYEYDSERDAYIISKQDLQRLVGQTAQESQASWTSGRSADPADDTYDTPVADSQHISTDDSQQSTSTARDLSPVQQDELARLQLRDWTSGAAWDLLQQLRQNSEKSGLCLSSRLKPSKRGGYIQVSFKGANKVMTLQEVLLLVAGKDIEVARAEGQAMVPPVVFHASHLCDNPACLIPEHICIEPADVNNSRKGCVVWFQCKGHDGCNKWFLVCPHDPPCIAPIPGTEYGSWEELLASEHVHQS